MPYKIKLNKILVWAGFIHLKEVLLPARKGPGTFTFSGPCRWFLIEFLPSADAEALNDFVMWLFRTENMHKNTVTV